MMLLNTSLPPHYDKMHFACWGSLRDAQCDYFLTFRLFLFRLERVIYLYYKGVLLFIGLISHPIFKNYMQF